MAWYDPSWSYRQKLTIQASQIDAPLAEFPVLISHANVQAALFARAKADGSDLVLTAADGATKLKRELVAYDPGGALELYVNVPSLSGSIDTEVYLYYGNAGAAETNDPDTWNAGYGSVFHLDEDPAGGTAASSTGAPAGTYDIAGATPEPGPWGGHAVLFDDGPRLSVPDGAHIEHPDTLTCEAWVNADTWPGRAVVMRKDGSYILYNYSGGFSWYVYGPNVRVQHDIATALGTGVWGYIAGTYDKDGGADNARLYLDGAPVATLTDTGAISQNGNDLGIGRHLSGVADPFNGTIDEVRISTVARSDAWIAATWRSLATPASFVVASAEETEAGPAAPSRRTMVIGMAM